MPYKDPEKAKESARKRGKAWRLRNIEAQRLREKEVKRKERQEKPTKARDQARNIRRTNIEKVQETWRRWKYGLSPAQYAELLQKQVNLCAICHKTSKLVVDHDHKTSQVRGLLCDPCNRMLGLAKDDPELLTNAIKYLQVPK